MRTCVSALECVPKRDPIIANHKLPELAFCIDLVPVFKYYELD